MMQLSYDVVRNNDGWAIVITPSDADAFATRMDAFDAAAEHSRKLRFAGYSMAIRPRGHASAPLKRAS
ncbi:MAG: hypothetical protein QOG83_2796 [Alphaproteobacteria bacterium]|jgi:hypothetical protein|nr:hypothetical protein [Alphaproteobacteria bacterium]MEA2990085.1 hypothetical protein [Alphaproteobacteria bacterium]